MTINVPIDEKLLEQARAFTGLPDSRAAVEQILREATLRKRNPLTGMLELAGTNPLREDYDYKALRAGENDDDRR